MHSFVRLAFGVYSNGLVSPENCDSQVVGGDSRHHTIRENEAELSKEEFDKIGSPFERVKKIDFDFPLPREFS
jgi:hypothetical protein